AIKEKRTLFDRPAKVAANGHAVDLFDRILTDVRHNQVAGGRVESVTIGIAKPIGIDFPELACTSKRVGGWNSILPVAADWICIGRQRRIDWIDPEHFSKCHSQVLRIAARVEVVWADSVGVAAAAGGQIKVTVRTESDRPAIVITGVLTKRNNFASRR